MSFHLLLCRQGLMRGNHNWHLDLLQTLAMLFWPESGNPHQVYDLRKNSNSFHPCRQEHRYTIRGSRLSMNHKPHLIVRKSQCISWRLSRRRMVQDNLLLSLFSIHRSLLVSKSRKSCHQCSLGRDRLHRSLLLWVVRNANGKSRRLQVRVSRVRAGGRVFIRLLCLDTSMHACIIA